MVQSPGVASVRREVTSAVSGFVVVFIGYAAISSIHLSRYGFTNDLGSAGYLAVSVLMYALIGAVMGAGVGGAMALFGRIVGAGIEGAAVRRFYYVAFGTALLYVMHFTLHLRDYLKYGVMSEHTLLWLLGVVTGYFALMCVLHQLRA